MGIQGAENVGHIRRKLVDPGEYLLCPYMVLAELRGTESNLNKRRWHAVRRIYHANSPSPITASYSLLVLSIQEGGKLHFLTSGLPWKVYSKFYI